MLDDHAIVDEDHFRRFASDVASNKVLQVVRKKSVGISWKDCFMVQNVDDGYGYWLTSSLMSRWMKPSAWSPCTADRAPVA